MKDDDTDKTLESWQAARKEMRRLQGEHNKAVAALDSMRATQEKSLDTFDAAQVAARIDFCSDQEISLNTTLARMRSLSDEYSRSVNKVRILGTKMQSSVSDEVSRDQGSVAGGLRKTAAEKAEAERVAQERAEPEAEGEPELVDAPPP